MAVLSSSLTRSLLSPAPFPSLAVAAAAAGLSDFSFLYDNSGRLAIVVGVLLLLDSCVGVGILRRVMRGAGAGRCIGVGLLGLKALKARRGTGAGHGWHGCIGLQGLKARRGAGCSARRGGHGGGLVGLGE